MSLDEKEYEDTTGHMAFYADDVKQSIGELKKKLFKEGKPVDIWTYNEVAIKVFGRGLI